MMKIQGAGGGGVTKVGIFFEDIAVPGNRESYITMRPLLRMTSTKTLCLKAVN